MNNPNHIFIGTYGNCVCIDQQTGKELWRTYLPGVAYSPVTMYFEDKRVYCGSNGKFFILCSLTGKILAQNEMVGQGYGFLTFTTKKSENQSKPQLIQPQIQPQIQFIQPQVQPQMIQPQFIQPQLLQQQMIQPQLINPQIQPQLLNPQLIQQMLAPQYDPPFPQQQIIQPQLINPQIQPQFIQPPLYDPQQQNLVFNQQIPQSVIPQPFLYQSQQGQQLNIQPNLQPQFPPNNDFLLEEQETLKKIEQMKKDEEFAKSLDKQLNGNNNNNNNLNNQNQLNIIDNNLPLHQQNTIFNQVNPRIRQNNNKPISLDDIIFVGLNSHISALNKFNASEIWKTNISGSYGCPPSIIYSNDKLLIGVAGSITCLDALTGNELWKNNLPGLRYSSISLVTPNNTNNFAHSNTPLFFAYQN